MSNISEKKSILNEVGPLCNTLWDQWPGYNMYCPVDNGSHVPAGCVAVAMAQVLYHWQCRVEGTGQHSYQSNYGTLSADFENANYQWYAMDSISYDQYNALLIYHCGVSTDMKYGPDKSGRTLHKAAVALRDYFGFPGKTKKIERIAHPFDWKSILIGNLNRGLAIIYGANETIAPWSPGHAWVIDGYNTSYAFHCNWGWGGIDNGYYELGNFCPPQQGDCFNQYEEAIIEIEPVRTTGVETPVLSAESFTYNQNGYTITIPEAEGATSYQWSCSHGTIQGSGTSATLYSDCNSTVSVRAYNSQCHIYSDYDSETMSIEYGPVSGPSLVCTSNSTFTLQNTPSGSTVTWTASRVTPSSGSGSSATFHLSSCSNIGNAQIAYTITNSCGTTQVSKTFVAGGPDPQDVELDIYKSTGQHANKYGGTWVLCPNTTYHIYCINNSSCSTTNYNWILPSSLSKNYQYNNMVSVTTNSNPGGNIIVKAQTCCTSCGSNVQILSDFVGRDYNCGYGYMSFTPNPARDEITLELHTENIEGYKPGERWTLEIYNQQQVLVKTLKELTDTRQVIHTSDLKSGVYYVRVMIGNHQYSGKFVIER